MFLNASSVFDTQKPRAFDLSVFDTNILNAVDNEDKKVKCRTVCDKKIYKVQTLKSAISFYKSSKIYHFTKY